MATVDTVIQMVPTYLPFERPPDIAALWTAIPRGLRGFIVAAGTLDAKPVNDNQTLTLNATLPGNFAYVFAEIALLISVDRAQDWSAIYTLNLQNFYQGASFVDMSWNFASTIAGLSTNERAVAAEPMDMSPKAPMWAPRGTAGIQIDISSFNSAATVALEGLVNAYITFWEFDLEQIRKYPINAPLPTHSR